MVCLVIRTTCLVIVVTSLCLAAASDLGSRTIPNGCVAAVAAARMPALACAGDVGAETAESLAGFGAVFALLLLSAAVSRKVIGSCGIGGGDLKLLSALGLWAGPVGGLAIVGLSCLIALATRLVVRRSREAASFAALGRGAPMPLAPSILAASLLALAVGFW